MLTRIAALIWPALLLISGFQPTALAADISVFGTSIVVTGESVVNVWADRPVEIVGAHCHRGYWWPDRKAAFEAHTDDGPFHITCSTATGCTIVMPEGGWVEVEARTLRNPVDVSAEKLHSVSVHELLWYLDHWFEKRTQAERDGVEGIDVHDLNAYLDGWFGRQRVQSSGS